MEPDLHFRFGVGSMHAQPGSSHQTKTLRSPAPGETRSANVVLSNVAGEPGTILLVENERFVRQAAAQILMAAGYDVLKARNAGEARREFARSSDRIQLLIADVVLPGASGCELWRELCAIRTELRTVFISGYPEITLASSETDRVLYLPKPFAAESLLAKVRQAFGTFLCEDASEKAAAAAFGM